ncbi:MAG: restriction endonuclease subunit S [Gammaproteobacteria bacterium]|nr:restriction endonuclease subunit S [Gammaproteobacteria bacterium]
MFGDPVTNSKGWDVKELDYCLIFLTSGARGWAKHYSGSGDKFIRIQNVSKNKLLLNDLAYVNAPDGAEANRTKTQIGDVLLSITADLGRAAVVIEEIAGSYINQHLALLRVKQNKLNPRYLAAYLSSEAGVTQFKAKNKSAVKAGLNFTDIRTLNILLPPIELQNKYEELYKKVTFSINYKQESLQFSESLFKSLSQKAFNGEL